MSLRPCPSFPSSLAALLLPALLAACGGNVVVTGGGQGGDGGSGGGPVDCPAGLTPCGGACVNTSSDPQNCGKCGSSCQGGACQGGQCTIAPGCPPDLTACGGACVSTATDPAHCGGCFSQCPAGASCVNGGCADQPCLCGSLCDYTNLGSAVPQAVGASLAGAGSSFKVPCAPPGDWPDVSFLWTAPYKASFTFDTFGSKNTAIQVLSSECVPYACNDDAGPGGASKVTVALSGGQTVLIVVDAIDGAGAMNLNISEELPCATCADYITGENFEDPLCPGSENIYNQLVSCICEGACAMPCFQACSGSELTSECEQCIFDEPAGCGKLVNECFNDI